MSTTRHLVPVTFTFAGHVEIEADSYQMAAQIAEASFGLVLGGELHESDARIVNWDFSLHPEKQVGEPCQ